jgi:hypothetical protein
MLALLEERELLRAAARISGDTGLEFVGAIEGSQIEGIVRRRVELTSGRFAMIANTTRIWPTSNFVGVMPDSRAGPAPATLSLMAGSAIGRNGASGARSGRSRNLARGRVDPAGTGHARIRRRGLGSTETAA